MEILKDELAALAEKYGDERRTEITSDEGEFTIEDLIAEEEMVVTISHSGYIKRTSVVDVPASSGAAGSGSTAQTLKDEDFIEHLFIASHARLHPRSSPTTGAASGSRCTRSRRRGARRRASRSST